MIKKSIVTFIALSTFAFGATLDTANAKTTWTGYKFYDKTPVSGTFTNIKYTWGKDTKSVEGTLSGAKAVIDSYTVDLQDELKNANVRDGFFKQFKSKDIVVTVDKIVTDEKDKNKGRLEVSVNMNGVKKAVPVWMPYVIENGKFSAKGVVDFNDFSLGGALAKLNEACGPLHEGKTWGEAAFALEIPVK